MIETKVKASTAASAVAGLALWCLGRYVFKGAVPDVVTSWTYAIIPAVLAFGAGWLARHTPRTPAATVMLPVGRGNVTVREDSPPPPQ